MPLVSRESQKLVIQKFEREVNRLIYDLYHNQRELSIEEALKDTEESMVRLPLTVNYLTMSKVPLLLTRYRAFDVEARLLHRGIDLYVML